MHGRKKDKSTALALAALKFLVAGEFWGPVWRESGTVSKFDGVRSHVHQEFFDKLYHWTHHFLL